MNETVALILEAFIILWSSYLLASLSGLFSEKSGIVNIGLNGVMVIGAMLFGTVMSFNAFTDVFGYFSIFIAIIIAGIGGMLFNYLFGIATITFYSDQIIAGTALNMISAALSILVIQWVFGQDFLTWSVPNPISGFKINILYIIILVIVFVIMIVSWLIIEKTTFGLRLKSSGENPYALETSGVSVKKVRYKAILIAGFLAGMAGAIAMPAFSNVFSGTVNGMGYIALAILIFGQWKILGITIGSFVIAVIMAFANYWLSFDSVIPYEIVNMLPFIIPIIILIFAKSSNSPKMTGKPFRKDERT